MTHDVAELEGISKRIRGKIVEMSHKACAPHLGSSLSCVDIMVAAYWGPLKVYPHNPGDFSRDRFILSKGHAAMSLYAVLAHRGFFPLKTLDSFGEPGGCLPEHPSPGCVPGLEAATGSLGHGLSLGLGMAIAGRILKTPYRVYALMSDGECNEGSVWEAAMLAPAKHVDNIIAIIDFNRWQATGRSEQIMALNPFKEKWEAFGWNVYEVDGHNMKALLQILTNVPDGSGKPIAIIARTVKGKGVSFMEDDNNWHYRIPNEKEVKKALKELGQI